MTERLTDAFVVKTSDATVANTNIGGRFRIDTISNDSLRLSVDDDDDLFTEENNAGNTEQTVGTWQYGSVTDGRGGSDGATGVVSNEDVWILRHPVTGEAVKVSRVRIEADDGQQGTDVFLGTYYLFDGPFQKGVDYEVVGYDHYPDEKDGHRYSDYSSSRIVCFAAGTLILTERGLHPVDRIRPGDRVQTADNGLRPVIWHGRRQVSMLDQVRDPTLRPIVVRQGAIGNDAAFRVSRQHRLLVDGHFVGAGRLARMGKGWRAWRTDAAPSTITIFCWRRMKCFLPTGPAPKACCSARWRSGSWGPGVRLRATWGRWPLAARSCRAIRHAAATCNGRDGRPRLSSGRSGNRARPCGRADLVTSRIFSRPRGRRSPSC